MSAKNSKMNGPTAAQRAAQSARDKALAKGRGQVARKQLFDYTFSRAKSPSASVKMSGNAPVFGESRTTNKSSKNRDIVEFDEYIGEINGSVAFAATKYSVNPGLAATFPQGSVEAALWTEWKMKHCRFYYKPEVSPFASQGTTGKVILAIDYNASNPAPTTKTQVELMDHVDAMPYAGDTRPLILPLDVSQVNRADCKYIRTSGVPAGGDIKTYDGGNLWVCTYGQPGATVIGELRAKYCFAVEKPTLLNGAAGVSSKLTSVYIQHAVESYTSTTPKAVAWDTLVYDPLSIGAGSSGVFTPPAGAYDVDALVTAKNNAATETFAGVIELMKNGASLASPIKSSVSNETAVGADSIQIRVRGVVVCNGSDTFQIQVTLTGATPSLQTVADSCQLVVVSA